MLLDSVDDMTHDLHGVSAFVPGDRGIPAPAHHDGSTVGAAACRVHPDDHRRRWICVRYALHRFKDDTGSDELVITVCWKLSVHLDPRLIGVLSILIDDVLVDLRVSTLYGPGIDLVGVPEVPLAVKCLIEVTLVTPAVRKREPIPVIHRFSEEAPGDPPDRVWDTAGFIEDDHHAVHVMRTGVAIRVLLGPEHPLGAPLPCTLLEITLHQLTQPGRGGDLGGTHVPPVRVQ